MAGFISGFRAGRSDELQRQQLKSQDQALRYKMGIDAEDRVWKNYERQEEADQRLDKENRKIMRDFFAQTQIPDGVDFNNVSDRVVQAAKTTGYYDAITAKPEKLISDISISMSNLNSFRSGEMSAEEAWTPEAERVLNLAFKSRLDARNGTGSVNGKPIVERKIVGIRPAVTENGEPRYEGRDPIVNFEIAVKTEKDGSWVPLENGSIGRPMTVYGTDDPRDQMQPVRVSAIQERVTALDTTAKFKILKPDEANILIKALGGSGGVTTNVYNTQDAEAEFRGSMVGNIGEDLNTAIQNGLQANKDMASLSQSLELLNSIEEQGYSSVLGTGGEFITDTLKLAERFGFDVSESAVASLESFFTAQGEMTLSYVQGTKGAISEKEMALFEKMSIGLGRSLGGNRLLITIKTRAAELNKRFGRMATDFRRRSMLLEGDPDRVGPQDWDRMVQEFQNDPNNSLGEALSPEVIDQIVDGTNLVYAINEDPKYGDVGVYDLFITMPNGAVRPATKTQIDRVLTEKSKDENVNLQ